MNGKTVQIYGWIAQPRYQKIHPLRDAAFGADCLTSSYKILKIITVGLKNGFW